MTSNSTNEENGFSADEFSDLMGMEEGPETTETETETETKTETEVETAKVETETEAKTETGETVETGETELDENSIEYWQNRAKLMEEQLANAYKKTPAVPEKPAEEETIQGETLFGEWKFDDIIADEESFKKFLTEFGTKIRTVTKESILKELPQTVTKLTTEQIETRKIVTEFYDANTELQSVKPFVAQITNQVASEHPDWTLPQVLEETAQRSYKALGLKKKVEEQTHGKKKPAFVDTTRNRRGNVDSQKSKLEKELEELMELE